MHSITHSRHHRHGFTLLEMAIVVTIIGILVGGLAATRNFLHNSELNSLVNESKALINGFDQFRERYGAVPGDMPNASETWNGVSNGDGNGKVHGTNNVMTPNNQEIFYAFQHLSKSGLIMGNYSGVTSGGAGTIYASAGRNVPASSISEVAFIFDHPNALDGIVDSSSPILYNSDILVDGLYGHYLVAGRLLATPVGLTNLPTNGFLTPKEALQIDEKFDDGRPAMGSILGQKSSSLATDCATSAVVTSALYNVTYKGPACFLIFKMQ